MYQHLLFVLSTFLILYWTSPLSAQIASRSTDNNGTVRGYVLDRSTQKGIMNAYVELLNYHPTISTSTDEEGYFELTNVPVGHQRLHVIRDGYYETVHPQLIVAGKEAVVRIPMEEQFQMTVVTVEGSTERSEAEARNTKQETVNPMNAVSARPVNMQEMDKYVGGYNDISRELTNFAGTYNYQDLQNSIVSRGQTPFGFQLMVEGVPVDNLSHLANIGNAGGFLSIINTNLLGDSDFANGVLSAEYGNAYSGILDAQLREGNDQRHERLLQVGLFGAEVVAEGPFKSGQSSYSVAARVGLFGLLQAIGVGLGSNATVEYADVNFKLNFPVPKMGSFSVFGIGGYSESDQLSSRYDSTDLYAAAGQNSYSRAHNIVTGLSHDVYLNNATSLKTTFSYLRQAYDSRLDTIHSDWSTENRQSYQQLYQRYGLQMTLNSKLSTRILLRAGLQGFWHFYDIEGYSVQRQANYIYGDQQPIQGNAFAQAQYRFSKKWSATLGIQSMYWGLSQTYTIEPRMSINWQITGKHRLGFGYGWHNKIQPMRLLLTVEQKPDGTYDNSNQQLEPTRSQQAVLTYQWAISRYWNFISNAYATYQTNVPIDYTEGSYSIMNASSRGMSYRAGLYNGGSGFGYGLEASLERFFHRGYYGLLTGSYQRNFYRGSDQKARPTAFDVQYIGSLLAGKEFKIGPKKRNVLYGDVRFNVRGGNPYLPIDKEASAQTGSTVYDFDRAYEQRFDWYKRLDVRVGMRFDHAKKRLSHNFYLEIINVTNAINPFGAVYRPQTASIVEVQQVGFFPNFLYQFRF